MLFKKKKKKKKTDWVEDMEFPGVLKNSKYNFQGLIKNNIEFPGLIKEKSFGISGGLDFRP